MELGLLIQSCDEIKILMSLMQKRNHQTPVQAVSRCFRDSNLCHADGVNVRSVPDDLRAEMKQLASL